MSENRLEARAALSGFHLELGETALAEITNLAIVSIAVPLGGDDELNNAIQRNFDVGLPSTGQSNVSGDGATRFLGLAQDQIFALFQYENDDAEQWIAGKLGKNGFYTLQSDNWVALSLTGPDCLRVLERICLIDLHPSVFFDGSVARTVMEHIGAIICREDAENFLLFSQRSSAVSFCHAVETAIRNSIVIDGAAEE